MERAWIAKYKVFNIKPEAEWSNHEQAENFVLIRIGGPNPYLLKKSGMTCG